MLILQRLNNLRLMIANKQLALTALWTKIGAMGKVGIVAALITSLIGVVLEQTLMQSNNNEEERRARQARADAERSKEDGGLVGARIAAQMAGGAALLPDIYVDLPSLINEIQDNTANQLTAGS